MRIPLSIGGSNSIKNLWPESYRTVWNARVKDRLEDRLHALVISGKLDLKTAQREIATDWIAAYKKYIGSSPPAGLALVTLERTQTSLRHPIRVAKPEFQLNSAAQVWVNTSSGKYFRTGQQWYGNGLRKEDSCLMTPNRKLTNVKEPGAHSRSLRTIGDVHSLVRR